MIDVQRETLMTLEEAAKRLKVTKAAITKWFRVGVNGRRLETVKLGGARRTSLEALSRFAQHPQPNGSSPVPTESARAAQEYIARRRAMRQGKTGSDGEKKKDVPAR